MGPEALHFNKLSHDAPCHGLMDSLHGEAAGVQR